MPNIITSAAPLVKRSRLLAADSSGSAGWVDADNILAKPPLTSSVPFFGGVIVAGDFSASGAGSSAEIVTRNGRSALKVTTAVDTNAEVTFLAAEESLYYGEMVAEVEVETPQTVNNLVAYVSEDAGYTGFHSKANVLGWSVNAASNPGGVFKTHFSDMTESGTWATTPPTLPIIPGKTKLRVVPETGQFAVVYIYSVSFSTSQKARVAVMWDDGYASSALLGIPVFSKRGIPSTMAVIPSVVGVAGYCSEIMLEQIVNDGCEVVCHGPNVPSGIGSLYSNYSGDDDWVASAVADMESTRAWLAARRLLNYGADRVYIWPQGAFQSDIYDTDLLEAAREAGFEIGRAANGGTNPFNQNALSPNQMLTIPITGKVWAGSTASEATDVARIVTAINDAADSGQTICLMFHRVATDDTADGDMTSISTRISDLITIADAIKTNVDAGKMTAITMSQVTARSV